MKHLEDQLCEAFVEAMDYKIKLNPKLKGLFYYHIPNGGKRSKIEGARFKRMGVRKGVCDYFVMRASNGYHGLYIECKVAKNKLTPEQKDFIGIADFEGYKTTVAYSSEQAIKIIYDYLGVKL